MPKLPQMGAIIFLRSPLWRLFFFLFSFFFLFFYCLFRTYTEVDGCASFVYYRVIFTITLDLFFCFFFILLNINISTFVVDFIFIYCFAELSHSFKTLLMHFFVNQIFWKLYTSTFLFLFFFFPRFTLDFLGCFLIVDGNLHGSTCPSFHCNISMRNGPL